MSESPVPSNSEGSYVPLSVPYIGGNEALYLQECLDSNWVSSAGPFVSKFEEMFSNYIGTKFGVATVNGTAALHIALLVAGVKPEHEVLVSTLTFIAPINAIRYVGAWPVLVDADPDSWQMDTSVLKHFLENDCRWRNGAVINLKTGRQVKAIMPVHILGHPCDMEAIVELASKYSLRIIEDATESLGSKYKGTMVGNIGDIACFSFNGNKLITTGGGGMLVSNSETWAEEARYLTTQAKDHPVEYIHNNIGYNYRLSNINAALGCGQLEQIDSYIAKKRDIARAYTEGIGNILGIKGMYEAEWATSVFWLYTILVNRNKFGIDSRMLLTELRACGIDSRPLWQPNHLSPAHSTCQALGGRVAEHLYRNCLSIPCSVGLLKTDQQRVIDAVCSLGTQISS